MKNPTEPNYLDYLDNDKTLFLVNLHYLELINKQGNLDVKTISILNVIKDWSFERLCKPHAELGRKGVVCPFTKPSISKKLFWVGPCFKENITPDFIIKTMMAYLTNFENTKLNSSDEIFRTHIILFPTIKSSEIASLIDFTHPLLKPHFVEKGFMLGQFYPGCKIGGVHNIEFKSLESPVPLFVIRNMVLNDYLFLKDEDVYLEAYIKHCSKAFPEEFENYYKNILSNGTN